MPEKATGEKTIRENILSILIPAIIFIFGILILSVIRKSIFGFIDPGKHVYFEIVFLLLLAVLAEFLVVNFKLQNVVVLMILGIMISPSMINLIWDFLLSLNLPIILPEHTPILFSQTEVISLFAQLGGIILLFKVGLHSKIEKIFSNDNLKVASIGVAVPFIFGILYGAVSKHAFGYSMFIGAALAATSVGVTVGILKELKVLGKRFSEIIIGAAVIDDILALLLLSVVTNLAGAQEETMFSILKTFATAIIFIIGAIISGKYFIAYLDRKRMSKKRFLLSLAFILFLAYMAEVVNLSAIVGAFLAGIILNKSRHYQLLEEMTYGLEVLFMPIFFVSLGLLVDLKSIFIFIIPVLSITFIAFASKIIGCGLAASFSGLSIRESIIVGIGMVPRGEVALIIASIGMTKGILGQKEYSIISAMALLTTFLVPTILALLIRREESAKSINKKITKISS